MVTSDDKCTFVQAHVDPLYTSKNVQSGGWLQSSDIQQSK